MGTYSIKDLEQLSGIKAHTLRIWEQRYQIITPKRTPTNIRYYDDTDLRLVLNIAFLNHNGEKISHIAKLSPEEIQTLVKKISDSNLEFPNQVNALVIAMVNLDEERFEKIISTNTLQFGFENTMMQVVYPFLNQIGILWQTGGINPAHEHFITNLIRQKLIVAIDGQVVTPNPYAKRYMLFLPEGEMHELTLLFAAYIIKARYNKVIYFGQNLPLKDLAVICDTYKPEYIHTIVTSYPSRENLVSYLEELKRRCAGSQILVAGYQVMQVMDQLPEGIKVFQQLPDLIHFVDENSERPFGVLGRTA
ncbi:MAG: MerR family transcriptional regulator [Bacteroidia bacterium]|nr:MerR family transcriptional regulator [Bacteroidia bacterium]